MKLCTRCKELKELTAFGTNSARKDGLQSECRLCRVKTNSKYYRNTPERNTQRQAWRQARRAANRAVIEEYLTGKFCVDCGNTDRRVFEFDHVRGKKLFNISEGLDTQPDVMRAELEKCEVRCANCHRIVTYERRMGP